MVASRVHDLMESSAIVQISKIGFQFFVGAGLQRSLRSDGNAELPNVRRSVDIPVSAGDGEIFLSHAPVRSQL